MAGKPPDASRVAEAARLHDAGQTTREIAAALGVDPTTVGRWLRESARRRGPRGRTDVTDALILRLRDEDERSFDAIAKETGMSRFGVRQRYYRLHGIERQR